MRIDQPPGSVVACPYCQAECEVPIRPATTIKRGAPVVTERTSKGWKGAQAAGCLLTVLGVMAVGGILCRVPAGPAGLLLGGGVGLFLFARIGAWWNHG